MKGIESMHLMRAKSSFPTQWEINRSCLEPKKWRNITMLTLIKCIEMNSKWKDKRIEVVASREQKNKEGPDLRGRVINLKV